MDEIRGVVTAKNQLKGYLIPKAQLIGKVCVGKGSGGGGGTDPYTGTYNVIPTFAVQSLPTEDKYCNQNITVHQIPLAQVANIYGGDTITIGG